MLRIIEKYQLEGVGLVLYFSDPSSNPSL